jgi:hypothetical protein
MSKREIKLLLSLVAICIFAVTAVINGYNLSKKVEGLTQDNKLLMFLYKRNLKKRPMYEYPRELNAENLKFLIQNAGIQYPEIVFRQAIIETGNLSCTNCSLDGNNLFGFRVGSGYKQYNTWHSSVYDYAQWQREHYKGGDYYQFLLDVGYAQDSTYIEKLKH